MKIAKNATDQGPLSTTKNKAPLGKQNKGSNTRLRTTEVATKVSSLVRSANIIASKVGKLIVALTKSKRLRTQQQQRKVDF